MCAYDAHCFNVSDCDTSVKEKYSCLLSARGGGWGWGVTTKYAEIYYLEKERGGTGGGGGGGGGGRQTETETERQTDRAERCFGFTRSTEKLNIKLI